MKKMNKFMKWVLLGLGLGAITGLCVLLFTASRMEYNFANDGKIMCVTKKDWGLFSQGDLNCFAVVPINNGINELLQTVQNLSPSGEIILKK